MRPFLLGLFVDLAVLGLFTSAAFGGVDIAVQHVETYPGRDITVEVGVSDITDDAVRAAQFDLGYDPSVLSPIGVSTEGSLTEGWLASHRTVSEGVLRVGLAGSTETVGSGKLLDVVFHVPEQASGSSALTLSRVLLNRDVPRSISEGSVDVLEVPTVMEFSYGLVSGWNLLSLPGIGDPLPLDAVSLGAYTWNSGSQTWMYLPLVSGEALPAVSVGMFLFADSNAFVPVTVDVDAPTARSVPVELHPGWNLVGAPSNVGSPVSFPVSALTGAGPVYRYDPIEGAYQLVSEMVAGAGYWVFNGAEGALMVDLAQPRDLPLDAFAAAPTLPARSAATWSATLRLHLDDGTTRSVVIGVDDMAQVGFDAFDLPLPPPPPGPRYAELFVSSSDRERQLARSVQTAIPTGTEWTVTARLPKTEGVIEWSRPQTPEHWRLHLEVDGNVTDMREITSARLQRGVHRLRIHLSRVEPSATRMLPNYPNPFNPETWIPFELREAASVTVRVYHPNGSLVRTLNLGRRESGHYIGRSDAAYWDGRNETGEVVASGAYLYELQADDYHAMKRMVILK